jgi:hypothetical protein
LGGGENLVLAFACFPRLPESLGMERTKKDAPTEAFGCTINADQDN